MIRPEDFPPLPHDEVMSLIEQAQGGDVGARNKLILHNMQLVSRQAHKQWNLQSLTYEDLLMEGVFGLIRAIEKFDLTSGNTFSTYAIPWINHFIDRARDNQDRVIRIPVHVVKSEGLDGFKYTYDDEGLYQVFSDPDTDYARGIKNLGRQFNDRERAFIGNWLVLNGVAEAAAEVGRGRQWGFKVLQKAKRTVKEGLCE